MEFNFAKKQAARNGRRGILWSVAVIAMVAMLRVFVFNGTVMNTFGPYAGFKTSYNLEARYKSREYYVTTQAESLFHTDYVMTEGGKEKWNFFAFVSGDQFVICRAPLDYAEAEYADITVSGKAAPFNSDYSELRDNVVGDVAAGWGISQWEAEDYVSSYIIYMDSGMDNKRLFDQLILVAMGAVTGWCLFCVIRALVGMANPAATKSYRKLAKKFGYDPAEMNERISAEMASGRVLFENKWLVVTDNWVGEKKAAGFGIYPKRDVVWIYRGVTQHHTNGIPSGKTHVVNLCTLKGGTVVVAAKNERDAAEMVEALAGCGFAAVFGYTEELQGLYLNNRDQFVALARGQDRPSAPPQEAPAEPVWPAGDDRADADKYKGPEL